MSSELTLNEWKTFLSARIEQEQGRDERSLGVFEELLRAHPDDPHLQSSKAFALERLGRGKEGAGYRIAVKYSQLASALSGSNDKPESWNSGLSSIINEVDQADLRGGVPIIAMVW